MSQSWWLRLLTALVKDIVQFSAPMSGASSSSISITVLWLLHLTPHGQIFILITKHKKVLLNIRRHVPASHSFPLWLLQGEAGITRAEITSNLPSTLTSLFKATSVLYAKEWTAEKNNPDIPAVTWAWCPLMVLSILCVLWSFAGLGILALLWVQECCNPSLPRQGHDLVLCDGD